MKDTDRLVIQVEYKDGRIQGLGYDGQWYNTIDEALKSACVDFKKPFKNVKSMSIIWNNNQLAEPLTRAKWGDNLVSYIRNLFVEQGVIQDGN